MGRLAPLLGLLWSFDLRLDLLRRDRRGGCLLCALTLLAFPLRPRSGPELPGHLSKKIFFLHRVTILFS